MEPLRRGNQLAHPNYRKDALDYDKHLTGINKRVTVVATDWLDMYQKNYYFFQSSDGNCIRVEAVGKQVIQNAKVSHKVGVTHHVYVRTYTISLPDGVLRYLYKFYLSFTERRCVSLKRGKINACYHDKCLLPWNKHFALNYFCKPKLAKTLLKS